MPYCKNCGTQVPEGTKFCQNCGTQVNETETVNKPTQEKFQEQTNKSSKDEKVHSGGCNCSCDGCDCCCDDCCSDGCHLCSWCVCMDYLGDGDCDCFGLCDGGCDCCPCCDN